MQTLTELTQINDNPGTLIRFIWINEFRFHFALSNKISNRYHVLKAFNQWYSNLLFYEIIKEII